MRVLITGGAGFLGSHLSDLLIKNGHSVICVDSLLTGDRRNIAHLTGLPNFSFVQHDVTLPLPPGESAAFVLHFASPASPADYLAHPVATLRAGAAGTFHALEFARHHGAPFLLASTSEVYGDPLVSPQREDYWGNVNPIGPRSVYDEAKRYAEALTMAYHRAHGLDTRIARIFNTYGPRMRSNDGRVVPSFIAQALSGKPLTVFGDGSQTRSFCFVSDLCKGVLALMQVPYHQPVNLGNPEALAVLDLARKILSVTGSKSPIEFRPLPEDDPKLRTPDISRARTHLHWSPRIQLDEGLPATIAWMRGRLQEAGLLD